MRTQCGRLSRLPSYHPLRKALCNILAIRHEAMLDGQSLSRLPSESFAQGLVAGVVILAGSNTDEGTATFFSPWDTLNTDKDVHTLPAGIGNDISNGIISKIIELYLDDPAQRYPFDTGSERFTD